MVIWLIGLAGAGKTMVGQSLCANLRARGRPTVLLDGDRFRDVVGDALGYTLKAREINGWRMCRMSQFLEEQGIAVVACVLSNFPHQQAWNRQNLKNYLEVFIDVPMHVLESRDKKGLYSSARAGTVQNVVGIDIPFVRPPLPDLVVDNGADDGRPEKLVDPIVQALQERGWLPPV